MCGLKNAGRDVAFGTHGATLLCPWSLYMVHSTRTLSMQTQADSLSLLPPRMPWGSTMAPASVVLFALTEMYTPKTVVKIKKHGAEFLKNVATTGSPTFAV